MLKYQGKIKQKNMNIKQSIGDYELFLDKIFNNLKNIDFNLNDLEELDHIAYRTEDAANYEKLKKEIIVFSNAHSEVIFGGRKILVCRLKKPLLYNKLKITGIELLAPKGNNKFKNGLEHAEFIVKNNLEDIKEKYRTIIFNLDAYDRKINPELIIEFQDCAVKLHTENLLDIRKI